MSDPLRPEGKTAITDADCRPGAVTGDLWCRTHGHNMYHCVALRQYAAARAVPAGLDVERLADALQSAGIPWGAFGVACDGSCTVVDHYRRAAERIAREYVAAKENDHE